MKFLISCILFIVGQFAVANECELVNALFNSPTQSVQTNLGNRYATYAEACNVATLVTMCDTKFYKCSQNQNTKTRSSLPPIRSKDLPVNIGNGFN